ncbi:vacuolar protein sorting-associated protein 26C isoform X1 [Hydra vulgaris]|uniref:vacuolar protein sorting-associated protein 26C isoform X1 n=1 Tax=Hydra vulgaris TaxID=6087 RepID=UPI001F5E4A4C|nr:vacuolar protein sorting-associated protein 26C [Hydra vulgaris]
MVKIREFKSSDKDEQSARQLSSSFDETDFEFLDESVIEDEEASYKSIISKKILTLDFSKNSSSIQLGIGGATGWLTGYLVGKVGKALAAAVGGSILLLNMGTRAGYITVDWEKVDTDVRTASDTVSHHIAQKKENEQTKRFFEKEKLIGTVVVDSRNEVVHSGITLTLEGTVSMQLSAKSVGLFEAFYNSIKPVSLLRNVIEVAKPGKLPSGHNEIPFEVVLAPLKNRTLYESYHGVFIKIMYEIKCEMKRSLLNKDLQKTCDFLIEYKPKFTNQQPNKEVPFKISSKALTQKVSGKIPNCIVTGFLRSVNCNIVDPFYGELTIENSEMPIKSIELQLVRVETCGCAEGYAKDATEIQNLQIADGDVCRGISIPIYMVLPRLFTCPTLETTNFKIEFEVNLIVVFSDDHILTENFPIRVYR